MSVLTVLCVLRSGGIYGPEHVERLHRQVKHHSPEARFVCLSDAPVACERIALEHRWQGWWSKIELFAHDWKSPVVYLDLDVTVLDDVSSLQSDHFTMTADFIKEDQSNSSVMAWTGHETRPYECFLADPRGYMAKFRRWPKLGDQAFIESVMTPRHFEAGHVVSYRRDCENGPPNDAIVVAFHGRPKPWDCGKGWAK